jgi:hypothetical protein
MSKLWLCLLCKQALESVNHLIINWCFFSRICFAGISKISWEWMSLTINHFWIMMADDVILYQR